MLMMHYSEHKRLFKDPYHSVGKHMMNFFMSPFMGLPPGAYRLHHVVMHHVENNFFEKDLSSTEPYQRDKFTSYLHYYWTYITHHVLLPIWALKKGHTDYFVSVGLAIGAYVILMVYGLQHYFIFTFWGFSISWILCGMVLMFGNYSQHILVNPKIATIPQNLKSVEYNCYLSMQCINHPDNQYAFNDGYHVTHHVHSRTHWTDMPKEFLDNLE